MVTLDDAEVRAAAAAEEASGLLGTRAQAMQRLQVGVGGLAALVLMVGLASTIMQQAREADDPAAAVAASGQEETSGDPLVDIGVVPEINKEDVTVPDLPAEQMVSEQPATKQWQGGTSQSGMEPGPDATSPEQ